MSAYRRKQKLFAKTGSSSMRLRAHTPENGFKFQREIPRIDEFTDRAVRSTVYQFPQLDAEGQTQMVYRSLHPTLPNKIDIEVSAPSMQKAVNIWHAIHNWIVYYRHHPEELRG